MKLVGRGGSLRLPAIALVAIAAAAVVLIAFRNEGTDGLLVDAPNSFSADLSWASSPAGTDHFEIYRDGRLIDEVPASTRSYRDYLLWQSTSYPYELRAVGAGGEVIASH
jgi:hypothetical protein